MAGLQMGEKIPSIDLESTEAVDNGGGISVTPSLPPKLIEFYKIDMDTGARIDNLVIDVNREEIPEDCKEGWGDRAFFDPVFNFDLNDWVENKPEEEILNHYKNLKDMELNKACEKAILDGFKHTINGIEYHFSYDIQAQSNFGDSREVLKDGIVSEIPWTVRVNGEYTRITLDLAEMQKITLSVLNHKAGNISKYRDVLLPRVMEATTIAEIQAVDWEDV